MKKIALLFALLSIIMYSCKKDEQPSPNEHITGQYWYKTNGVSKDTLFSLYIPNAFTPDGNGVNDMFSVVGRGEGITEFQMKIFDRWGQLIFISQDIYEGWDGNHLYSASTPTGVYTYQIIIRAMDGNTYEKSGNFMLY
jgi:gliding motility-associated-like protein